MRLNSFGICCQGLADVVLLASGCRRTRECLKLSLGRAFVESKQHPNTANITDEENHKRSRQTCKHVQFGLAPSVNHNMSRPIYASHATNSATSPNPAQDELHTHNPCSHHQNQQPMMSTQSPNTAAGRRTPNTSRITPSQPHRQHRAPRYKHTENSISNNCTNN